MSDAELLEPVTPHDEPAPADEPAAPVAADAPVSEDADLDQMVEEQAIELPNGTDKLVPLAAVEKARAKLRTARDQLAEAKKGSEKATELEGQIAQLQQQLSQVTPYAQAYQAALQAQQQEPAAPTREDLAQLEAVAKTFDFYKTDGSLDLDRAKTVQAMIDTGAERKAQAAVQPIQQQTVKSQSDAMLRNAKVTTLQDGTAPQPEILDWVWSQLDPSLTGTKAGAQQAYTAAVGYATMLGKMIKPGGQTSTMKETLPPVLLTEKSGGRIAAGPTLSEADKRDAKELGIPEKEYAESLARMPAGWGRKR